MTERVPAETASRRPPGELWLRVRGGPRDGDLLRVTARACAIGTDAACNLRLQGPSARPLHCLIIRGSQRTIVRTWSPRTLLNGHPFSEAVLSPGDRLTTGPLQFEVVAGCGDSGPHDAIAVAHDPGLARRGNVDGQQLQTGEHPQTDQRRISRDHQNARSRRLIARLRELGQSPPAASDTASTAEENADLEARQAELAARAADLDRRAQDLADREHALDAQRGAWAADCERRGAEFAAREQSLEEQSAKCQSDQQALAEQTDVFRRIEAAWEAERSDALDRVAQQAREIERGWSDLEAARGQVDRDRMELDKAQAETRAKAAELDGRQAQLEADTQAHHRERLQFEDDSAAAQQSLASGTASLDEARRRLDDERAALRQSQAEWQAEKAKEADKLANLLAQLEQQRGELTAARQEFESQQQARLERLATVEQSADHAAAESPAVCCEPPQAEAPPAGVSLLSRIGLSESTPDEAPQASAQPQSQPAQPSLGTAASSNHVASSPAHHDDEDSIEGYMARLLERVGMKSKRVEPVVEQPSAPVPVVPQAPATPPAPQILRELPAPLAAPGFSADLTAMRELANLNARTLLDDHFRRRMYYMTVGKASVMVLAILIGAALLWLSANHAPIAVYPAMVSFAIAVVWGFQYAIGLHYLWRARKLVDGAAASQPTQSGGLANTAPPQELADVPAQPEDASEAGSSEAVPLATSTAD